LNNYIMIIKTWLSYIGYDAQIENLVYAWFEAHNRVLNNNKIVGPRKSGGNQIIKKQNISILNIKLDLS
jgi:hypothetical protein